MDQGADDDEWNNAYRRWTMDEQYVDDQRINRHRLNALLAFVFEIVTSPSDAQLIKKIKDMKHLDQQTARTFITRMSEFRENMDNKALLPTAYMISDMIIPKLWTNHNKELRTMKMQYNLPNSLTFYDHFCQQYYASESDKRGDIDWFIEKCADY